MISHLGVLHVSRKANATLFLPQLMNCYSNRSGVYVVDLSLSVDQKRQQDNDRDCMSCM